MKNLIILFMLILCFPLSAQRWRDKNKGLYPNSIQATYNVRNTALGVVYGRLFDNTGLFIGFSNTIKPDMRFNTYEWERKYSAGLTVALPKDLRDRFHTSILTGVSRNTHNDVYSDELNTTSDWSFDLGVTLQEKHLIISFAFDFINSYAQLGCGYTF